MSGEEHRKEAERLLKPSVAYYNGGQTRREHPPTDNEVARAQVHATLALVAAIAEQA